MDPGPSDNPHPIISNAWSLSPSEITIIVEPSDIMYTGNRSHEWPASVAMALVDTSKISHETQKKFTNAVGKIHGQHFIMNRLSDDDDDLSKFMVCEGSTDVYLVSQWSIKYYTVLNIRAKADQVTLHIQKRGDVEFMEMSSRFVDCIISTRWSVYDRDSDRCVTIFPSNYETCPPAIVWMCMYINKCVPDFTSSTDDEGRVNYHFKLKTPMTEQGIAALEAAICGKTFAKTPELEAACAELGMSLYPTPRY